MEVKKKGTQWRVYKPNKSGSGAASRLEMKVVEEQREGLKGNSFVYCDVQLFWVSSPQTGTDSKGNATFAWSVSGDTQSITLKMFSYNHPIGIILSFVSFSFFLLMT